MNKQEFQNTVLNEVLRLSGISERLDVVLEKVAEQARTQGQLKIDQICGLMVFLQSSLCTHNENSQQAAFATLEIMAKGIDLVAKNPRAYSEHRLKVEWIDAEKSVKKESE